MIDFEAKVYDNGLIDAYADLCQHAPDFVNGAVSGAVNDIEPAMMSDFRQEPGVVKRPIRWTSERQRRFVMAQIRAGKFSSPYVRMHAISQAWRSQVVYSAGEMTSIEVWNANEITTFVEGLHQQQWHKDTGWFYAPDKFEKWGGILTDVSETALIKAFYAVEEGHR